MTGDANDLEFEGMSETQIDAMLDRMMKEYSEIIDQMTPRQLYYYRRNRRLDLCIQQRRLAKKFPGIFLPKLRDTQRRLLEARIEYRTGAISGHS